MFDELSNICVITGCELADHAHERWAHGDLHRLEGVFIFVAVCDEKGETRWHTEPLDEDTHRVLCIGLHSRTFERKGIIFVEEQTARLNHKAWIHAVQGIAAERCARRRLHG